jgi:hypothetical protein
MSVPHFVYFKTSEKKAPTAGTAKISKEIFPNL